MRILMLSWEFPPNVVGGLGRHVAALSRSLVAAGHEVHVITRTDADSPAPVESYDDGIHVIRVPEAPPVIGFDDLIPWVLAFNSRVQAIAGKLLRTTDIDVVHAHDWLVTYAATGIKETWDLPVVATVHATEYGRHQGYLPGPMNKLIHQVEWWLTYEARRVIVCSGYMREQVETLFTLPADKTDVVPNGVDLDDFAVDPQAARAKRAELVGPRTRMVLFAGRLEYEKGVQTLLDAFVRVRATVGPTRLFVAGVGTYSEALRARVRELGLQRHVRFTGFVRDAELKLLYGAADVAVAPSIYEPFGLVAVEAMACGTPVVVSDTGGLREIVADDAGLSVEPQDPGALAAALGRILTEPDLAARLVANGRRRAATRYDWSAVARRTVEIYGQAIDEEHALRVQLASPNPPTPLRTLLRQAPILELDDAG